MKFIRDRVLFSVVQNYLESHDKFTIVGPLTHSELYQYLLIQKVRNLRQREASINSPYLLDQAQVEIENELQIDERSYHFIIFNNGDLAASVRLTPAPYEASRLTPGQIEDNKYGNFLEFSRLITNSEMKDRSTPAMLLLIKAGLWCLSETTHSGIFGLCKIKRVRFLSRFGLKPLAESLSIPNRGDGYSLMSANREELLTFFSDQFLSIKPFQYLANSYQSLRKSL
jgi:hypothetical protein